MCLHLCNWIDQQHPAQIDSHRSLIFCFSLFLIICQISCPAACFLFYWKGWGPLENAKKFSFYLLLSAFSWNSDFWGEFWPFPWNLTLCGIPNFWEFRLFSWTSNFLGITTSFLEFWLFGGILTFLGIQIFFFWGGGNSDFYLGFVTFSLEFWHFSCYSDFFWLMNVFLDFWLFGNSIFFLGILTFWVNSDFFLGLRTFSEFWLLTFSLESWLFSCYSDFFGIQTFSWTSDFFFGMLTFLWISNFFLESWLKSGTDFFQWPSSSSLPPFTTTIVKKCKISEVCL